MTNIQAIAASLSVFMLMSQGFALADPCGMVPPIWTEATNTQIRRIGPQKTYVFFDQGIETMVLRPAFSGKIEQFGMLIPFPSPPAIRKVSDDTFSQIANAIDPPEIPLWVRPRPRLQRMKSMIGSAAPSVAAKESSLSLAKDEVRVIKREAVGMYEVVVLAAGSTKALKAWMVDEKFRFPEGMEDVTSDYVEDGWCFVAVKARVGAKSGVQAKPGMRSVDSSLPSGASFDGAVQAMGFRFKVDKLVVPMRLSAFNPGERRNIVYALTPGPMRLRGLPRSAVVRQVSGKDLVRNITGLLPVRVMDGTVREVKQFHLDKLKAQRDPDRHLGIARELFASDLRAVFDKTLIHDHEELEKSLTNVSEELGLRGKDIDRQHQKIVDAKGEIIYEKTIKMLSRMTLNVIDADFSEKFVAAENLQFLPYRMRNRARNTAEFYDAKMLAGAGPRSGHVFWGTPEHLLRRKANGWGR